MTSALTGRLIALAEGRQLEELAQMLEKEGAATLRCPLLAIHDPPDDGPALAWLQALCEGKFAWVIFLTGEGIRRLLACAERHGRRDEVVAALRSTRILTRGPKPGMALKEIGLAPTRLASAPTTAGVLAALAHEPLEGLTVGVQLYSESNPPLSEFLARAGAREVAVQPYVYAPAADGARVAALIEAMAAGKVDCLLFTSSPQVDRLYEVATERQQLEALAQGLARTKVASVGPLVSANLLQRGARVDLSPEQGFVMKNLVQIIKRAFQAQPETSAGTQG